jgi:outer membrane protein OmpA-like peptidoglycan-associated protein
MRTRLFQPGDQRGYDGSTFASVIMEFERQTQTVRRRRAIPAVQRSTESPLRPISRTLQERLGNHATQALIARALQPPPASDRGEGVIERLFKAAGNSATRLRQMLAANPADAIRVEQFFESGHDHPGLNALMAGAFPRKTGADKEKDPEDPALPLPAERKGDKNLSKGKMKWSLTAVSHSAANVDIDFKPDPAKVEAKNVSFVQNVVSQLGTKLSYAGTSDKDPVGQKTQYQPYEEAKTKQRVDHIARSENDPFYGAMWSATDKKWVREGTSTTVASSTKGGTSTSAKMTDEPSKRPIRIGFGDFKIEFETVPMILETREPLGALKWGWSAKDEKNAPLVLIGGVDADCTDAPSASHAATVDKFYKAKFDTIVDEFVAGKWDLTAAHKLELDKVAAKMKGDATLKAQLGGAADLKESDVANVSLKRAEAVRDYLVSKNVPTNRITLESYGSDWARVKTTPGADEPKNRRVQVWVK